MSVTVAAGDLRRRLFLRFGLLAAISLVAIAGGVTIAWYRLGQTGLDDLVLAGLAAAAVIIGMIVWLAMNLDETLARPLQALSNAARGRLHAMRREDGRISDLPCPRALEPLGSTLADLCRHLDEARLEVDKVTAEATRAIEARSEQLEAVLRDLRQGVVICNMNHEILLYNQRALEILHVAGDLGLGRNFFGFVAAQPFQHGLEQLRHSLDAACLPIDRESQTVLVIGSTRVGNYTLKARMTLALDSQSGEPIGYVTIFDDITNELAAGVWRDHLLKDVTEDMRQRIANVMMVSEWLVSNPHLDDEDRRAAAQVLKDERLLLTERLERLSQVSSDIIASAWPMAAVPVESLFELAALRRSEGRDLEIERLDNGLIVNCDSVSIVDLLDRVLNRVAVWAGTGSFALKAEARGERVYIELSWKGEPVPAQTLDTWLNERLDEGLGPVSVNDVLSRHKTDMWSEPVAADRARIRMPLTAAEPAAVKPQARKTALGARPEFYDFDLFRKVRHSSLEEEPLRSLTFVVFDTETTGLEPGAGDEIVQIAGIRIVNGRLLKGEVFDELVNPGRKIPKSSSDIHKITDAMVADAPAKAEILSRFRAFAADAVLVAHNAAFDMRFLTKDQDEIGVRFDNAVLDTVLLAAAIFGAGESLTLDNLAQRFAIDIPPEARHTALGDTVATAEVLLRMISLLEASGISTLRQALDVSLNQASIRRQQAQY